MNTPLTLALASLLALIAVPATRELLRAKRDQSARRRLVPIRIERANRPRDPQDR